MVLFSARLRIDQIPDCKINRKRKHFLYLYHPIEAMEEFSYVDDDGSDSEVTIHKIPEQDLIAAEMEEIGGNPALMSVMQLMVDQAVKAATTEKADKMPKGNTKKTGAPIETKTAGKDSRVSESPSDATIYAPALGKEIKENDQIDELLSPGSNMDKANFVNDISSFIEAVQIGRQDENARE